MSDTKQIDDGGPAFPAIPGDMAQGPCCYWGGMTLRDWFAGQVLIGLSIRREGKTDAYDAQLAYRLADAMLAARKEKQ